MKFRSTIITLLCLLIMGTSFAQSPMTVRATVTAGATENNVYAAIGQPFYQQIRQGGYELSYGVAQAQLVNEQLTAETCENQDVHIGYFNIPAEELTLGTSEYEKYINHVDSLFGYDLLTHLTLSVWPIYAVTTSKMYHGEFPVIPAELIKGDEDYQIHEGENIIGFLTVHGCDSVVTLYATLCPYTVKDADSIQYSTLVLDEYCWTNRNMKTTHYMGDAHTEVTDALIYNSQLYPNTAENEAIYGRLYTWHATVGDDQSLTADGFVQGICPDGWHIPAAPEVAALNAHSVTELRSADYWQNGAGVNTTGFSLLPAGMYNSVANRFEGLHTDTRLWYATDNGGTAVPSVIGFSYYCDDPLPVTPTLTDAYSVRCVMDY